MKKKKQFEIITLEKKIQNLCAIMQESGDGRYRPFDIFRWTMAELLGRFGLPVRDKAEERALDVVNRVVESYLTLVEEESPFTDILGPLYMELASHGGKEILGQFFTPQNISYFMALMMLGAKPDAEGPLLRACDPASGSGVMMLSFCMSMLKTYGPESLKRVSVTCVDIDAYCAEMSAIQFLINLHVHHLSLGELVVFHGNSLAPHDVLRVVIHATHDNVPPQEVAPAKHPARLSAIQKAAESQIGQQMAFFEDSTDEVKKEVA